MKKTDIILFVILNIVTSLIFTPWLLGHYATDTYNVMNVGYEYYSINNSLVDGRIFMYGIMQIAAIFQVKYEIMITLLLLLAIIISNISVLIIKNIIIEKMQNKKLGTYIVSYIIAYSLIYNFMYIENLYFLECFVMAITILLNLIAAKIYFEEKKHYLIKTLPLLLISIFCYQGTISTFIVFLSMFLLINKCNIKKCLKKLLIAIIMTAAVCIINLIFINIISNVLEIEQSRLNYSIIYNLAVILIMKPYKLIYTSNNFYPYFLFGFLILLLPIFMKLVNKKNERIRVFLLLLVIIFIVELPYIVTLSAFESGRTQFGIGALFSIYLIYIITQLKIKNENNEYKILKFIYGLAIIYFIINIVNYKDIIANSIITNKCEKEYVQQINEYITEYEKKNDIKIEKIQLVYDNNIINNNNFYDMCTRKNTMTWNAVSCYWSAVGVINFYTNRNLLPATEDCFQLEIDGMYEIKESTLYVTICVI